MDYAPKFGAVINTNSSWYFRQWK